jgi:hypothetical protein
MSECKLCGRPTITRPPQYEPLSQTWEETYCGEWNPSLELFCIYHFERIEGDQIPFCNIAERNECYVVDVPPTDQQIAKYVTEYLCTLANRSVKNLPLFECEAIGGWTHREYCMPHIKYRPKCWNFAVTTVDGHGICGVHRRQKRLYFVSETPDESAGEWLLNQWLMEAKYYDQKDCRKDERKQNGQDKRRAAECFV